MPLFICHQCGAVENTGLGAYWHREEDPICSECDTGTWHGQFPKEHADNGNWIPRAGRCWFVERIKPK